MRSCGYDFFLVKTHRSGLHCFLDRFWQEPCPRPEPRPPRRASRGRGRRGGHRLRYIVDFGVGARAPTTRRIAPHWRRQRLFGFGSNFFISVSAETSADRSANSRWHVGADEVPVRGGQSRAAATTTEVDARWRTWRSATAATPRASNGEPSERSSRRQVGDAFPCGSAGFVAYSKESRLAITCCQLRRHSPPRALVL